MSDASGPGSTDLDAMRETVATVGQRMYDRGLTSGTGGNVSVRRGDRVAVSPSGVPYDEVTAERVPVVDLDGEVVVGTEDTPTSELPIHTAVYRERDDLGGVVHTHSPYATTFACLAEPIPASYYELAFAGPEVPVVGYAPPGSRELAHLAAGAFDGTHDACLLQNHGVVAGGADGEAALETAEKVEYAARIHYQARSIGEPVVLDDDTMADLVAKFDEYRTRGD
ncbi:MAG: class II aldolase/adducin family protein [Haloferacaceae archaeon]